MMRTRCGGKAREFASHGHPPAVPVDEDGKVVGFFVTSVET